MIKKGDLVKIDNGDDCGIEYSKGKLEHYYFDKPPYVVVETNLILPSLPRDGSHIQMANNTFLRPINEYDRLIFIQERFLEKVEPKKVKPTKTPPCDCDLKCPKCGKLTLTDEEVRAVKDSIEHWKVDIQKKFLEGDIVMEKGFGLIWKSDDSPLKNSAKHCPLCNFYSNAEGCFDCPYVKKYGHRCDEAGAHWLMFARALNLQTCNDMIEVLEGILK